MSDQGLHPNGTWHHRVESVLTMTLTYEQAVALLCTLNEATPAPSHDSSVRRIVDFLHRRTRIARHVVVEEQS